MKDNIAIKVDNLTKIYPIYNHKQDRMKEALSLARRKFHLDFYALKDVSFEIKKGETIGIIGQNGSGKSTLLKILAGVLTPTTGEVNVNGKISALLELGAGFNPEMTGRDNIYLNGTIMGYSKEEMDIRVPSIVGFADIGEFIDQPVKMYSSGMFVRLAFAVAINVEPEILIVDEALAVGDIIFQRKCFSKIEELKKKGVTILFVSHDRSSILELCKKAILLQEGEKILYSNSKHVISVYDKLVNMEHSQQKTFIENIHLEDLKNKSIEVEEEKYSFESFDKSLALPGTIHYENKNVKIFDYKILNKNGETVNVLIKGRTYFWTYSVLFEEEFSGINFGMLIKNRKGIELGGSVMRHKKEEKIKVEKDKIYKVKFEFQPNLLPDIYFLNCGVTSEDEEFIYLDRKLDAAVFRVEAEAEEHATGMVDFCIRGGFQEQ